MFAVQTCSFCGAIKSRASMAAWSVFFIAHLFDRNKMLPRKRAIMKRTVLITALITMLWPGLARAQNAKAALDAALAALGATNLRSIEFSGRGFDFMFGQAYDPNSAWPRFGVPRYNVAIDYPIPAIRDDLTHP